MLSGIAPSAKYKVEGSLVLTVSFSADVQRKDDPIPFRLDGELRVLFHIITLGFTSLLGRDVLISQPANCFSKLLRLHMDGARVGYLPALGPLATF